MTTRLYLETNFLVSHAKGRDAATSRLLEEVREGLQITFPSCCVMEALTMREGEEKRINQQIGVNSAQINELVRHVVSDHAATLVPLLTNANQEWQQSFNFFENRLSEAINWLSHYDRVELLATKSSGIALFARIDHEIDPTDQLILATILDDAQEHPLATKVLVTENGRCFHDDLVVRQLLQDAGIKKYFPSVTKFLQWYDAQAES